ncbi:MAG: hypothetical protein L0338_03820 [Acidobacteria bacterium]|nr:hypothetical protein [Acidobacteriota bacterium]
MKSVRKERPLIELFLSAYENDGWKNCAIDWLEDKQDGAVEVIAKKPDGTTLALEHTLIQPFVGEKSDSERFLRAFSRIEKNPALTVPARSLDVVIPVGALPVGCPWGVVGDEVLSWLIANHATLPEGRSEHRISVGESSKNGPLALHVGIRITNVPGSRGHCLISRDQVPQNLGSIVEKALRTKLPKLVKTAATKRILLFERDQMFPGDGEIYDEVAVRQATYPDLAKIDELWFANTSIYASEKWVSFELIDGRGLVELLVFESGVLKQRRDDRPHLGLTRP